MADTIDDSIFLIVNKNKEWSYVSPEKAQEIINKTEIPYPSAQEKNIFEVFSRDGEGLTARYEKGLDGASLPSYERRSGESTPRSYSLQQIEELMEYFLLEQDTTNPIVMIRGRLNQPIYHHLKRLADENERHVVIIDAKI